MNFKKSLGQITRAISGKSALRPGPDGFPVDPDAPGHLAQFLISAFLAEVPDFTREHEIKPGDFPSGRKMLEGANEDRIALIEAMMVRRAWVHRHQPGSFSTSFGILQKLTGLLRRHELPYTAGEAAALVQILSAQMGSTHWFDDDLVPVLKICERLKSENALSPALLAALSKLKASMNPRSRWESAVRKRAREAIDRLIAPQATPPLDTGEAWSNAALEELQQMSASQRDSWLALVQHCREANSSKPTQKWSRACQKLIEAMGQNEFKARVVRWLELAILPRPVHREPRSRWEPNPDLLMSDRNSLALKGLAWSCAGCADQDITRALSRLAEACFKKIPNLGARCPRVGNACLYSLSVTPSTQAAAELSRLNQLVKQPSAKKLIGKSLDKAAELSGQTREDLEESTVPAYGLDAEGCLKQRLGDFTAEYKLSGPEARQLFWRKADGKLQKSIPVEVKENHAKDLKALRRTLQDIEKMLPAQRQRLERLLFGEREWDFPHWRERYLDHPLMAQLCRRLVWHFRQDQRQTAGIWHEDRVVDRHDQAVDWLSPKTRVRLWHPLGEEVQTVASWRQWLEAHQVTQPFKQAHREIYVLTDAERQTGTYSNRFAAHVLRQHQFAALAKERGWTYRLQGAFDSHNTPTLLLPRWDLAAEFWVEAHGDNEETSHSGIYLYLSTDQVRFCDPTGTPRSLSEVPALVFSEVMRDVDLFIGVCSIGNDPNWHDQGEAGPHGGYWYNYSFGDLSVAAKSRREVLERLLPRLKIASQCNLSEKFLVVKGSLRTYKIHLGSSNILMEPNDQYLCIVPDRGGGASLPQTRVFLPFEGDNTLAVILSKAFLLAQDDRIKDQSIVGQITPK